MSCLFCLQDFQVDALVSFIEVSSAPVVTMFNKDPSNHPYVIKFFNSPNDKVRADCIDIDLYVWHHAFYVSHLFYVYCFYSSYWIIFSAASFSYICCLHIITSGILGILIWLIMQTFISLHHCCFNNAMFNYLALSLKCTLFMAC